MERKSPSCYFTVRHWGVISGWTQALYCGILVLVSTGVHLWFWYGMEWRGSEDTFASYDNFVEEANLFSDEKLLLLTAPAQIQLVSPPSINFGLIVIPLLMGTIAGIILIFGLGQRSSGVLKFWLIFQTIFVAVVIVGLAFGLIEKYFKVVECFILGMALFIALFPLCIVQTQWKELLSRRLRTEPEHNANPQNIFF